MRRVILWGFVCLLCAPVFAHANPPPEPPPEASPADVLAEAEAEFRQGQYRRTVDLIKPLLDPQPTLDSEDDKHRAREILGAAYWHLDEKPAAREQWTFLLLDRPGLELDQFTYPKPMRDFFDALRQTLIAQGVIKAAVAVPDPPVQPTVLRVTHYVEQRSRAITFMPFGVAQFDQDQDGWGTFFAAGQGAAALTSIGTFIGAWAVEYSARGRDGGPTDSDIGTHSSLVLSAVVSGAVFYGLYAWGVIDANVRHQPSRLVRIEEDGENTKTVDTSPPQPPARSLPGGSRTP